MVLRLFPHFNPRSLTGATIICFYKSAVSRISIHAPSRERHAGHGVTLYYSGISIHAPSRERHRRMVYNIVMVDISIHAPSRERPTLQNILMQSIIFQSTLPRGSDSICPTQGYTHLQFQSTLPRGSDPGPAVYHWGAAEISIHAPSRERPYHCRYGCGSRRLYFNPRSLAGATRIANCKRFSNA